MRKSTSSLLLACLFLVAFAAPKMASATHAAGGELLYEWVSGSTYTIYYKFYRACGPGSTSSEPATQNVCYYNSCNSTTGSVTLTKMTTLPGGFPNGSEVTSYCPTYNSYCNGGSLPGYREWWYSGQVTLTSQCNFWTFFTGVSARNNAITNLNTPGSQALYVEATLNNAYAQGNSSPYFTVKPTPFVCANVPFTYNNGAVDPNSDSMSFELINPLTGPTGCTYPPNATGIQFNPTTLNLTNNPFNTNNTFSLSATTGQMSFTANGTQIAVVTLRVKEWRNGVLIGTVMRDIQVIVLTCSNPQPTINTVQSSITGATMNSSGVLEGCAGQPLQFCADLKSSSANAVLIVTDNHSISIPGSNVAYTGQLTDSVRACFNWSPGFLDTGLKVLSFSVKDSNCAPPGIIMSQTFSIPIYIWPVTNIYNDTTICPGDSVNLVAVGGSTFSWSVLPGGSPLNTLSCTNCKNPVAKPTVTTKYVVTSNNLGFCNKNKDTVTITVVVPPSMNLGPDTSTCVNNNLQLNLNLVQQPGTTYNIQWSPTTYLNNSTIDNPIVVSPVSDITYYVTVLPNGLGACAGRDTITVRVLQGFDVYNGDTAICAGAVVNVIATGDSRYTYTWVPTQGVSNPNVMNPSINPDTSKLYTVKASYPGCLDSFQSFYIDVQPNPIVYVGPDRTLCYGDTVHFDVASIVPSSYPNYDLTWTPPGSFNNNATLHPIFTAYQSANVVLTVKTPAGCSGSDNAQVDVYAASFIDASNDTAICPRDTIQLHVKGTQISQVWRPGDFMNDTLSTDPIVYPIASMKYTVYARSTDYCLDTAVVFVKVNPEAIIALPDTARIYPGESYQLDPRGNCSYYQWFPPTGLSNSNISNPIAKPDVNTRYVVYARTEGGCTAVDSIDLFVSYETLIDMPNAFTPGASPNATLKPSRRGIAELKAFRIYDRWGIKVYESSNIDEGWNGQFNGKPQPMGVYVYTIEAVTPTGRVFSKQGNITLIR